MKKKGDILIWAKGKKRFDAKITQLRTPPFHRESVASSVKWVPPCSSSYTTQAVCVALPALNVKGQKGEEIFRLQKEK